MALLIRILCSFIGVLLFANGMAQDQILRGQVNEKETGLPLRGVNISIKGTDQGTTTDASGDFTLLIDSALMDGLTLKFQRLGFDSKEMTLTKSELLAKNQEGGSSLEVFMTSFTYPLDTAFIMSDPLPEIVYSSTKHNVADYAFMGNDLLILVYPRRLEKGATLYLMNQEMEVKDSIPLDKDIRALGLRRDYANRVYLEASGSVFLIDHKIDLEMQEVDSYLFNMTIAPIVDTVDHSLFFGTQGVPFPAIEYYDMDRRDSLYTLVHQVADKFMLELCRAEYKYLSTRDKLRLYRLELETGVEKEVLACISSFEEGLYYEAIYAPLFLWLDTLYLFDHTNDRLWIYDKNSQLKDSIDIDYHQPEKFMGNPFTHELLMDEGNGRFYAVFQKPGGRCWLELVDTETGESKKVIQLKYPYPSGIKVKDAEVYYLYRPFESTQKKFLYKERL